MSRCPQRLDEMGYSQKPEIRINPLWRVEWLSDQALSWHPRSALEDEDSSPFHKMRLRQSQQARAFLKTRRSWRQHGWRETCDGQSKGIGHPEYRACRYRTRECRGVLSLSPTKRRNCL